ncbi:MAG: polymer-forming cytoskeletal protein [Gammaproteobacteria bacterium]|nr:polymer-forming cytoskeletal protein [Gammaproteobacteria bacterium]
MSNPYDNSQDKMSVLGPTLTFKGELSAEEDLMLKGRVEGSIRHTASLRIGREGSVKGDIKAKYITVEGQVEGDLYANASVSVKESANVQGNIYSPTVGLIEGAQFKGSIDMERAEQTAATPPGKSSSSQADADASAPEAKIAAAGGK